jgi:hypothetical protein
MWHVDGDDPSDPSQYAVTTTTSTAAYYRVSADAPPCPVCVIGDILAEAEAKLPWWRRVYIRRMAARARSRGPE